MCELESITKKGSVGVSGSEKCVCGWVGVCDKKREKKERKRKKERYEIERGKSDRESESKWREIKRERMKNKEE